MNLIVAFQSLTIILSPLYILRSAYGLPIFELQIPTTFLESLVLIAILLTFFQFIKDGFLWKKLKTRYDLAVLLFLIAATIAVFYTPNKIGGLGILKAYFYEPVLFFYSLVYVSRQVSLRYVFNSLLICGLWLSVLAVLQKITSSFSLAPHEIIQGRVSAVYNSANSLSLIIGPIAVLALGLFIVEKKNLRQKMTFFLLFVLFSLVIIWTKSRGGLISEITSIGIFAYAALAIKIKTLEKFWYVLPAVILSVIIIFLYQVYLTYNFIPENSGKPYTLGDTLQIRFFIWTGTINMLRDHPILGAGLDGFKTLYSNQYRLPQFQEQFQYPHNLILTFWTETGIIGLFSFLLLMVGSVSLVIRNLVKSKNALLGAGLLAALSYIFLHGVVDVPYFKNDLSLQFWVLLALIQVWQES